MRQMLTARASLMLLLAWAPAVGGLSAQSDKTGEDVYLLDLGIVIEGEAQAGVSNDSSAPGLLSKAEAGAEYIDSARELKLLIDDLLHKISALEGSLDEDVDAVRLENLRLRALISKLQEERTEVQAELQGAGDEIGLTGHSMALPLPISQLPDDPSYANILAAYRSGRFEDIVIMSRHLQQAGLETDATVRLSYWIADAFYHTGRYEQALAVLAGAEDRFFQHALRDDAIVLEGLVLLKMGRPADATARFQEIIDRYPDSEYLRLAKLTVTGLRSR